MARTPFNEKWASNGDKTPFAEFVSRVRTGWEGGLDKDAPIADQQNAWQARADDALQDLERYGVMTWEATAVYAAGAPTYYNGNYYESLQAGNTNQTPDTATAWWRQAGTSFFSAAEPGDAKMVFHDGAPSAGWLVANGAVLSRAAYPRLFAKIGTKWNRGNVPADSFMLPDTRGKFMRGYGAGGAYDSSRVFGTFQGSSNLAHTHNIESAGSHRHNEVFARDMATYQAGTSNNAVYGDEVRDGYSSQFTEFAGTHTHDMSSSGGTESRPVNETCVYWIKF